MRDVFAIAEIITDLWPHRMSHQAATYILAYTSSKSIDAAHLDHQRAWSRETFGPGDRVAGVLDHIRKELAEIEAQPDDITEWADLIILAFDGALRRDFEAEDIIAAIKAKQAKNETRTWPDWRTADPNKAIEHVREAGQ